MGLLLICIYHLALIPVFVGSNLGYFYLKKEVQILSIFMAWCQVVVVEMDFYSCWWRWDGGSG